MRHRHPGFAMVLVLALILSLALAGCRPVTSRQRQTADAPPSKPGDEGGLDVVSAEGTIVPLKEADLSFKMAGRVDSIEVAVGDKVTVGQVLARLETQDLEQEVRRAEAGLQRAQAQLARVQAGARIEQVTATQAAADITSAAIGVAESAVQVEEGNLAAAQAGVQAAQGAIKAAEAELASAKAVQASAQAELDRLKAGPSEREIRIAEELVEVARNELWARQRLKRLTDQVYEGELEAYEKQVELAQLQLEALKAGARIEDIAAAEALVSQAQASVDVAVELVAQARATEVQAQIGVRAAEAQVAQAQGQVQTAKAQAAQADAQLDLVTSGSRAEDVAVAEAQLALAEANLAAVRDALQSAVVRAPFDGVVAEILVDEGEVVTAQVVTLRIGDLSRLQVRTEDLSEVDVDLVRVGQAASITVDALGGRVLDGLVTRVAPISADRIGQTVYAVTLDLGADADAGLRWGMTAFVEIWVREGETADSRPASASLGAGGSVVAEGVIVPEMRVDLGFRIPGRIASILVSEGEAVRAGQELARLETEDLEGAVQQAEAGLRLAQAQLASIKAGPQPESVAVAEAAVDIAQSQVAEADDTVQVAEEGLAAAQASIQIAEHGVKMAKAGVTVAKAAELNARASLDKVRTGPTDYDISLAQMQVELAKAELQIYRFLKDVSRNIIAGQIAAAESRVVVAQLQVEELMAGARPEDLANVEALVSQAQAGVQSAEAALAQAEAQRSRAQADVQIAQAHLAQAQAQLAVAKAQVVYADAELDLAKASSLPEDIRMAEAEVAQAQAALTGARSALEEAVLRAALDGIIAAILVNEGELVGPSLPVIRLGDLSTLRVETLDLSEVDVRRISVGQNAKVTIDALEGITLEATVASIAPVGTERRGDTVYAVMLDLAADPDPRLRWGMTAYVEIVAP